MWGQKSRSLGQILEKAFEHPRSHICGPNVPKLDQNVSLDKYHVESKKYVTKSNWVVYILETTFMDG